MGSGLPAVRFTVAGAALTAPLPVTRTGRPSLSSTSIASGSAWTIAGDGLGKIGVIVSHCDWLIWGCRPVRVPIETVVILARHLNLMDIPRQVFLALPSWTEDGETQIAVDDTIKIGLGRR